MKCKFCGNDLPEESKFCPSCGAPVEPEEKQEQTEQSAEAKQQENQNPYEYGVPGTDNGSGAQNENPYQYGNADQNNENPYQSYPEFGIIRTMPKKKLCRKILLPHVFLLFVSNSSA